MDDIDKILNELSVAQHQVAYLNEQIKKLSDELLSKDTRIKEACDMLEYICELDTHIIAGVEEDPEDSREKDSFLRAVKNRHVMDMCVLHQLRPDVGLMAKIMKVNVETEEDEE